MTRSTHSTVSVFHGRALGHRFEIRCNDPELTAALWDALSGLVDNDVRPDATVYELMTERSSEGAFEEWTLSIDGIAPDPPLRRARYPVERLMWSINRAAVAETPGAVRVHAAVAERDGLAVILPASMEAGKTTLVTALVGDGFRYVSDEIAALDPASGEVIAYPKPLGLDPGSWPLFPHLAPPPSRGGFDRQWLVSADRIRPRAIAYRARPALVIAPRYRPGAAGNPVPLDKLSALRTLADQTFRFRDHPQRDLDTLADLVRSVPCHHVEVDDLVRATEMVHTLLDQAS